MSRTARAEAPAPGRAVRRRPSGPALAALGFAALLGLLTWQVAARGPVRELDERVGPVLSRREPPARVGEFLADLGGVWVVLPVLAAALLWAVRRGVRGRAPVAAAVAFALVPACVIPLKSLLARGGPQGPLIGAYPGFFPSGHATTSAVGYGAAALLLLPLLRSPAARRILLAGTGLLVLAVGAGLVWRDYHWPLDVAAGWCLAGVLLSAAVRAGLGPCGIRRRPGR